MFFVHCTQKRKEITNNVRDQLCARTQLTEGVRDDKFAPLTVRTLRGKLEEKRSKEEKDRTRKSGENKRYGK